MDDELLTLRAQSYAAGLKHDKALRDSSDVIALLRLPEHLARLAPISEVKDEEARTRKLLDMLDQEIESVQQRLRLLR